MLQNEKLHVVAVISNPVRYQSRARLYKQFAQHLVGNPHVVLHTVEAAFGARAHEVTDAGNSHHLRLRTSSEIWHKENMINLGLAQVVRLYPDAKYIAWVDADVRFTRSDWAIETLHKLQHHQVVQLWSHAIDLGPNHEALGTSRSFASFWASGAKPDDMNKYGYWHTGYAWAARREALELIGGLLDFAVLGSADFYMAWSMIGLLGKNLYNDVASLAHRKRGFHLNYIKRLFQFQERCHYLKKNIGVVTGTLEHFFHGRKKQRNYNTRENILINNGFDPDVDLRRDTQGLWQLVTESDRQIQMSREIQAYFRARNEDSIDLE